jgi:hypothetical protein
MSVTFFGLVLVYRDRASSNASKAKETLTMARLRAPKRVIIRNTEAHQIIGWLFSKTPSVPAHNFTKEDCGFAQAMLVEMIDKSFAIGFIESLFRASAKLPSGPKKVIIAFLKGAGKNLVKYKDKDDLNEMMKKPVIYKMAKSQMARLCRSVWSIREQTGDLIY